MNHFTSISFNARDLRRAPESIASRLVLALALLVAMQASAAPLPRAVVADRLVIDKSERTLTLWWHGVPLKIYRVALGGDPVGTKVMQGDKRTPEGIYSVVERHVKSEYYRALHLSYPSAADRARARAARVKPGGDIEIHGLRDSLAWVGSAHTLFDWTDGCIAVNNAEMEELWRAAPIGTPVEIRP